MPAETCKQHCAEHDDNTAAINKHAGLWVFVFLIITGSIAGGWYLIDRIETQNRQNYGVLVAEVGKIRESAQEIKLASTAYIAKDSQRTREMTRQLDDHENRLRALESSR